jgi:hypothetical protein
VMAKPLPPGRERYVDENGIPGVRWIDSEEGRRLEAEFWKKHEEGDTVQWRRRQQRLELEAKR